MTNYIYIHLPQILQFGLSENGKYSVNVNINQGAYMYVRYSTCCGGGV